MKNKDIKYPEMRKNLIDFVKGITDPEYQKKIWVKKRYQNKDFYDSLTHTIESIYDNIDNENPEKSIGYVLKNEKESNLFKVFFEKLERFIENTKNMKDEDAIKTELWKKVMEASKEIYNILCLSEDSKEI